MRIHLIALLLAGLFSTIGMSQPVYERHTYEVYPFLARMAQKGLLEWNDNIRPILKTDIVRALDTIANQKDKLSSLEKAELAFYQGEYSYESRKRLFGIANENFNMRALPVFSGNLVKEGDRTMFRRSIGMQAFGQVGKKWGYQLFLQDFSEKGKSLDTNRMGLDANHETGFVLQSARKTDALNYLELRGHLTYQFNKGSVSIGQDYLLWGYGQSGRIVLSDKAPTYPYFRLDINPYPWLRFNYTHAWLKSDLIDSARSYTIPNGLFGGVREVFIAKYMATHTLDFRIRKGLNLSIGESMIYTDRMNAAYLIPVLFFKAFDNYAGSGSITRGSNGQFFFQVSSRDQIKNTHLYATLLIDEIKISRILDKKEQRNQIGYTLGGSVTDLGLPYLQLGMEYTKVRPFVYRNFLPQQNYTNANFLLGDWMGANADRISLFANYTPLPRLKIRARYMQVRKGEQGTLDQQYFQQPQPPFLFGNQISSKEYLLQGQYEYIPRLYLTASFRRFDQTTLLSVGMNYGL
jgi:hypothetical protein